MEEVTKVLYALYLRQILWQGDDQINPYRLLLNYHLIVALQLNLKNGKDLQDIRGGSGIYDSL